MLNGNTQREWVKESKSAKNRKWERGQGYVTDDYGEKNKCLTKKVLKEKESNLESRNSTIFLTHKI